MELSSDSARERYGALVSAADGVIVGLDFDGTLSPIVDDPEQARIHADAPDVLVDLAEHVRALAVVTGRPARQALSLGLDEVGERLANGGPGAGELRLLGQYGNERWSSVDRRFVSPRPPRGLASFDSELTTLLRKADADDAYVERKGLAVAVHTRRLPDPAGAYSRLLTPMTASAERHGATVLRGTEVHEVLMSGGRTTGVRTSGDRIDAGVVVLAAGVWTRTLAAPLGVELPIRPMRLQVVATEALPPMLDRLLYGPRSIRQYDLFHDLPSYREELFVDDPVELDDELPFLELACQTPEGRFLLGCPMDFPGEVWQPDLAGVGAICRYVTRAIPSLAGVAFERAWAGLLPHMPDGLPVVDSLRQPSGTYVAAGHVFGNSSALATAAIVTAMVRGERPPIDPSGFAVDRPSLRGSGTRW